MLSNQSQVEEHKPQIFSPPRDFVDREEELDKLQKAWQHQLDEQCLFLHGIKSIGKTSLMAKFSREKRREGNEVAYVDLPHCNFFEVVSIIWKEFSLGGFPILEKALEDLEKDLQSTIRVSPDVVSDALKNITASIGSQGAEKMGVSISGQASVSYSQIAGGHIFNQPVINVIYNHYIGQHKLIQKSIETTVTTAFLEGLVEAARQRSLTIILDHWESTNDTVKEWLIRNLFDWVVNFKLPNVLVILAAENAEEGVADRSGVLPLPVELLPISAVRQYWVENHLPAEVLEDAQRLESYRFPLLLKRAAAAFQLQKKANS